MTDGVDDRADQERGLSANPVKQEEGHDGSDALRDVDHAAHLDELLNEVSKSVQQLYMQGDSRR